MIARAPRACAWGAGCLGGLALSGWTFEAPILASLVAGWATMKPNAALALVAAAGALGLLAAEGLSRRARIAGAVAAWLVAAIGALTLLEILGGRDLGIDRWLFSVPLDLVDGFHPFRMSPATAASLVGLGLGLLLLALGFEVLSQVSGLGLGLVACCSLVAYGYGPRTLEASGPFVTQSLPTALALLALGLGLALARPRRGLMAVVTAPNLGGVAARRLLPLAVAVPILLGWLQLEGEERGFFDDALGSALFVVAKVVVVSAVVWWTAWSLCRLDGKRLRAEEAWRIGLDDLKLAEAKARHYARQLERSNWELERFAYVASHDLQEPLRTLAGFSELLSERYSGRLDGDADEFLGFIRSGALRMQTMVQDLLSYSRVGTHGEPFAAVDCAVLVDEVIADLGAAIEEAGARVSHDALPTLEADRAQLRQAFTNLVGNALKYRRPGVPPEVRVSAERVEGAWQLAVTDNGIGIEPQYFERIFVVFQRLHGRDEYPGTGIGLAITQRVVERHGGRIWVESRHGEGSTFRFTIPDSKEAPL